MALLGIILAGGRSSRMGQDKASLNFHGRPLLEHMADLLRQAGATGILVSGTSALPHNYRTLPDHQPHAGPGLAIAGLIDQLDGNAALILPVDMPFLTPETLITLTGTRSAHYHRQPLPLYIPAGSRLPEGAAPSSIRDVAGLLKAKNLPLPEQKQAEFRNLNTPEDWNRAQG